MTPEQKEDRKLLFHPYNVYLTLLLFSLTMLFLAFSAAYVYTRFNGDIPPIKLPWLFFVNTFILMGTSWTMTEAKKAYRNDQTERYKKMLVATIIISFTFMLLQGVAWNQLFVQNVFLTSSNLAAYVYLVSALHFLHVFAGLPFLIFFYHKAKKRMKEPVSVLIYFSDPYKRLKLRLLTLYWHFLDILWIYLVLFFWVNYLLS